MSEVNANELALNEDPGCPNRLSKELSDAAYLSMRVTGTLGTFFGFPRCCRDFFEGPNFGPSTRLERNFGFTGTGLRVCPVCLKKTFYEVYRRIRSNRFCHTPFPIGPGDDVDNLTDFDLNFLRRVVKEYELVGEQPPREVLEILESHHT